ncbi:MAG TPA: MFS transporter [Caulobacteraceae bacterium]|jgi:YNFM family putative membrane transporter|nr:MFS transporter [Caulobacteraceae bacterium]
MVSVPADELPPPISRGTPAFRRMILALVAAGFSTFALLYCVQPLLPVFAQEFHRSAAQASLSVSAATGVLAGALLFWGTVADRVERRRMMFASVVAAGLLTLVVALAPSWPLLLLARGLTGLALSGVPAVALTYIGEEVDADSIGLAVGLHIGGNVFGGMAGRLVTGVLADHFGWRTAVAVLGVMGLVSAGLLRLLLPASRRFRPQIRSFVAAMAGLARPFGDAGLPWLFLESFLCMGAFVTVYNYIGFRLLAAPYHLSQTAVGFIFALYLLGVVSSPLVGDIAGRLGRRKVFWVVVLAMAVGAGLTAARPLWLVIAGVALFTFAFFGAHSTASSWVGRRAGASRAQASSMFLFFYYLGASVIGYLGGVAWGGHGWTGVVVLLEGCLGVALAVAVGLIFLRPLPGNLPVGAHKTGS